MNKIESRVAIIGGGHACYELLTRVLSDPARLHMRIMGVADPDPDSPGMVLARENDIPLLVDDYHEFLNRDDIDLLIELTGRPEIRDEVVRTLSPRIHFLDHFGARLLWDIFELSDQHDQLHREFEEKVLSERTRLRNILDSLPYEILVIDKDYKVKLANRTFLNANKLTSEQVIDKYCYELDHKTKGPCDISLEGCPHAESLGSGHAVARVISHEDERGHERFAAVRAAPIRDDAGNVLGVVEAIRDITVRVRTEEELKETRARLDQFIDTAPLFIYMKNAKLHYRVVNRHALEALRLQETDVVGKTDFDLFPEAVARRIHAQERKVLQTGQTIRTEGILPLPGRKINFIANLFPVRKGEEVVGLFGLVEDTTELHESEEQLHKEQAQLFETREYLAGILENSRDLIFLTNPAGNLLSFNAAAEEALGYKASSVLGKPMTDLVEDPQQLKDLYRDTMRDGHAVAYEMPLLAENGDEAICNVSLTLITGPDGAPLEVVGICRDLTSRLRLQQDLIQSERLAAIGKMAAGVAHEINNPLAVIDTIAGAMQEIVIDEKDNLHPASRDILLKATDRLKHQIERCSTITHSLLGFMRRSQSGLVRVDVTELLDETLNLLAAEIHQSGVEIRCHYGSDLPRLYTNPMQLEQVLVNLVKNAVEAVEEKGAEDGFVEITTRQADKWYEIVIEDNGIGIPPDAMNKIFDLFHTSKPIGTGLGLAIVHDIVNGLGGEIRVNSEEGQWTRFLVRLPLQQQESTTVVEPASP